MKDVCNHNKNDYTDVWCQGKDCRSCKWFGFTYLSAYCAFFCAVVKYPNKPFDDSNNVAQGINLGKENHHFYKQWDKNGNLLVLHGGLN